MLEICSFSLESCLTAQNAGAGRVELCGGMFEGGTTPSAGLIRLARQHLSIQLYVMIRPRGGEFCYSNAEFEVMKEDILIAKNAGADGVVFGILNPDGSVDKTRTTTLVDLAKPMKVTFHRAFDVAKNPFEALEDIINCGCERILTSGQKNTAIEGLDLLKALVEKSNNRIEIMAGSGVSAQNAQQFLNIGIHALHMTGKGIQESKMIFRKSDVSMASASLSNEYEIYEADFEKCKAVVDILKK
ncbi:Copper homeostasis protein CutC [Emticicia aquatica]|jgi:copper homeostasis protein|uniref:PF03932 family protein CutC n=1 Tax=Emticicia aquatica TaxID=1681835 RepID=A0ABN8EVQ3_9BACT|nr:copper homeostasis protein CutC [Emticicia aquatica]CAH0997107.1 Copper homeostasis protein CutC [Emticicia aquatica]